MKHAQESERILPDSPPAFNVYKSYAASLRVAIKGRPDILCSYVPFIGDSVCSDATGAGTEPVTSGKEALWAAS
jgi:hypothetical protein